MTKLSIPRTTGDALDLLALYSRLDAQLALNEANRQAAIAATDAAADAISAPIAAELAAIEGVLSPWWKRAAAKLTGGKRKSIELGGCQIGSRAARASLQFAGGDDKAALAAVMASPQRTAATVAKRVLDKPKIIALLNGRSAAGKALHALGFDVAGGDEVFFIKRVDNDEAKAAARIAG